MSTNVEVLTTRKNWKELYQAVLLETDRSKLSERIAHAEWALALRARELFYSDEEHRSERLALDAAISVLQALRSTTTGSQGRKGVRRVQSA